MYIQYENCTLYRSSYSQGYSIWEVSTNTCPDIKQYVSSIIPSGLQVGDTNFKTHQRLHTQRHNVYISIFLGKLRVRLYVEHHGLGSPGQWVRVKLTGYLDCGRQKALDPRNVHPQCEHCKLYTLSFSQN